MVHHLNLRNKNELISQQSKVMTYEDRDKYQKYLVNEFYIFLGNAKGIHICLSHRNRIYSLFLLFF